MAQEWNESIPVKTLQYMDMDITDITALEEGLTKDISQNKQDVFQSNW